MSTSEETIVTDPADPTEPAGLADTTARLTGEEGRVAASAVLARVAEMNLGDQTVAEQIPLIHQAVWDIGEIADQVDDEIGRLSVLRMKESLLVLSMPADPPGPGVVLGLVTPDRSLMLDEVHVSGPLKEMYDEIGAERDEAALRRYKFAASELFHQQAQLTTEAWTDDDSRMWADPAVRLVTTGVVATWTALKLGEFVAELKLDEVASGIAEVQLPVGYPAAAPVVQILIEGIAMAAGLEAEELLRQVLVTGPASKFAVLAEPLLTSTGLTTEVPAEDLPEVRAELQAALRAPLLAIAMLDVSGAPEGAVESTAAQAGNVAFGAAYEVLAAVSERFGIGQPAPQDPPTDAEDVPLAPPVEPEAVEPEEDEPEEDEPEEDEPEESADDVVSALIADEAPMSPRDAGRPKK
ncbi:hypothetical protein AB0P21_39855 [Kribbella sp. NPDC056861]|uniref:hypothetical protein n=1 Tax=Kribbella sp. NPDC056861 TaxID=3154857 RepID=UPI00341D925C